MRFLFCHQIFFVTLLFPDILKGRFLFVNLNVTIQPYKAFPLLRTFFSGTLILNHPSTGMLISVTNFEVSFVRP